MNARTKGTERGRDGQKGKELGGYCSSQVFRLFLSYVTHMIHVEPRGAGIALTFCIQPSHTQPTNTKEMCPQIPSPRAVCTVYVWVCVQFLFCLLGTLVICECSAHTGP